MKQEEAEEDARLAATATHANIACPPQLWAVPAVLSEDHKFRDGRSAPGYAPRSGFRGTCAIRAATLNARACHEITVCLRLLLAQTNHHVQDPAQIGRHLEEAVAVLPPYPPVYRPFAPCPWPQDLRPPPRPHNDHSPWPCPRLPHFL